MGWVPTEMRKELERSSALVYQIKATLMGIRPPIWRRILVQGGVSLGKLHSILQRAMGWTNSHLYMFHAGDSHYSRLHPGWEDVEDEGKTRLCNVAPKAKDRFVYEYDMGDSWEHEVVVERIAESDPRFKGFPVCLDGARACPPEDCGGIGGYEDLLAALRDPKHEEHNDMVEWVGGNFDSEAFDLEKVNRALRRLK